MDRVKRPVKEVILISFDLPVPLGLQALVESLLAAGLLGLDFAVLSLEASVLPLQCQSFLDKVLLAVLLGDTTAEELGRTLDDGTNLRVLGDLGLAILLLVMPLRVKHRTHPDELQVSLELCGQLGFREVEPIGTRGGLVLQD